MTIECMEHKIDSAHVEKWDRSILPSAVEPAEILEKVGWLVGVPLGEGNLPRALRAVVDIWNELHERVATRDIMDDPVSVWLDDDKVCGILWEAGIENMLHLMEQRPIDLLSIHQVGEGVIRKIARVQRDFRKALDMLDGKIPQGALPAYRESATMSE